MQRNGDPVFTIENFGKGINQQFDGQLIGYDEASKIANCEVKDGTLKRSKGVSIFDSQWHNGAKTIMAHYKDDRTFKIVGGDLENNLYIDNVLVYDGPVVTVDTYWKHINYQIDDTYVTIFINGEGEAQIYDGATFKPLKFLGKDSNEGDWVDDPDNTIPNRAPKGKYITLHKERVWMAKDNTVYFSNDFDPHDWTAPSAGTGVNQHGGEIMVPTWDGGEVIGLENLFDDIMIFKNHNVFRIFGTNPQNYEMVQIFRTTNGEILERTIASEENVVIWTSTEGIYIFNGTNTIPIHRRVQNEFDKINWSEKHDIVATIWNNKYILAIPQDEELHASKVLEYDLIDKIWTVREGMRPLDFIKVHGDLLYVRETPDTRVYKYEDGDDYKEMNTPDVAEDKPINAYWESGDLDFGMQNAKKIISKLYFTGSGNGDVIFSLITERGTVSKTVTLDSTNKVHKVRLKNKGRLVKVRIENDTGSDFIIKKPQFVYDADID